MYANESKESSRFHGGRESGHSLILRIRSQRPFLLGENNADGISVAFPCYLQFIEFFWLYAGKIFGLSRIVDNVVELPCCRAIRRRNRYRFVPALPHPLAVPHFAADEVIFIVDRLCRSAQHSRQRAAPELLPVPAARGSLALPCRISNGETGQSL